MADEPLTDEEQEVMDLIANSGLCGPEGPQIEVGLGDEVLTFNKKSDR